MVTALGYGTTGLSVGQRVFGLADWYRDGTLAEFVAIEARNLAPLPGTSTSRWARACRFRA
jgi:NADPH:quinone reductase-like Zn-dependent oxidoreductase